MTKAEEKRIKQATEVISMRLRSTLADFENDYVEAYVEYFFTPFQQIVKKHSNMPSTFNEMKDEWIDTTWKVKEEFFPGIIAHKDRYSKSEKINHNEAYSIFNMVKRARMNVRRAMLTKLKYANEAANGYQIKFDKMVAKVVEAGLKPSAQVEEISNNGSELSFQITDGEKTVHARAIFVCGSIKAPHYRFITTVRKEK